MSQLSYDFRQNSAPVVDKDGLDAIITLRDNDVVRTVIRMPATEDAAKGEWVLFVFSDNEEDFRSLIDWAPITR